MFSESMCFFNVVDMYFMKGGFLVSKDYMFYIQVI
jgi:hypothetical protein